MLKSDHTLRALALASFLTVSYGLSAVENPYVGEWELTIPSNAAGWLGVEERDSRLSARMLWGWGSVEQVQSAAVSDGRLVLQRKHNLEWKVDGKTIKTNITETITATVSGDSIKLTSVKPFVDRPGTETVNFSGKRQPPLPPAPDLSRVSFGQATPLFNGKDLSGWRLVDPNSVNGWSVKDGLLVNNPTQEEGKPHKNYGNLRTERDFEDFNLKVEVRLPEGGNSGVYLRGIYEIQVADSFGKPPSAHGFGALYSRITPTSNPSRKPGEWQTMEITLVDRHVTVIINGTIVLDNQPVQGCTGGALWSDVSRPGPIYLQGDHTGVEYRSLILRPVAR